MQLVNKNIYDLLVYPKHQYAADKFRDYLQSHGGFNYDTIKAYHQNLGRVHDGKRYSARTRNFYLAIAKSVTRNVLDSVNGEMLPSLKYQIEQSLRELKPVKVSNHISKSKILTDKEVKKLINTSDVKLSVVIGFLRRSACRISEMCGVLVSDCVSFKRSVRIRILGKGSKERHVYIPVELYSKIIKRFKSTEYLFQGSSGRYNRSYWSTRIKRHGLKILGKKISAHVLRHSSATLAIGKTKDVKATQLWLGHASSSTTLDLYCHSEFRPKDFEKIFD